MIWLSVVWKVLTGVPRNVWLTLGACLLLLVAVGGAYRWSFNRGAASERAACMVERAKDVAAANAAHDRAEKAAADARSELQAYLSRELPKIEAESHDAVERIRVVYKNNPVAANCVRPEPVVRLLGDAIERANRSAKD